MQCPKCKNTDTKVIDSRDANDGKAIRRRRSCTECEYRFTTFETIASANFVVIKRDGSREAYNREKLEQGIWRACEKRKVTQEQIDKLLNTLEREWAAKGKEVSSTDIGEGVMNALKKLDDIAYIRFASVYREFKDIETFKKELQRLFAKD